MSYADYLRRQAGSLSATICNVREFILSRRLTSALSLPVLFRLPTSCGKVSPMLFHTVIAIVH